MLPVFASTLALQTVAEAVEEEVAGVDHIHHLRLAVEGVAVAPETGQGWRCTRHQEKTSHGLAAAVEEAQGTEDCWGCSHLPENPSAEEEEGLRTEVNRRCSRRHHREMSTLAAEVEVGTEVRSCYNLLQARSCPATPLAVVVGSETPCCGRWGSFASVVEVEEECKATSHHPVPGTGRRCCRRLVPPPGIRAAEAAASSGSCWATTGTCGRKRLGWGPLIHRGSAVHSD